MLWQCFVALSVLTLSGGLWCWSSGQTCGKTTGCHLSPCLAPGSLYIHLLPTSPSHTVQWMSLKPFTYPPAYCTLYYTGRVT